MKKLILGCMFLVGTLAFADGTQPINEETSLTVLGAETTFLFTARVGNDQMLSPAKRDGRYCVYSPGFPFTTILPGTTVSGFSLTPYGEGFLITFSNPSAVDDITFRCSHVYTVADLEATFNDSATITFVHR